MLRRRIGFGLALGALALACGDAAIAAPGGPRLAVTQLGPSLLGAKVITVGPTGSERQILAGGTLKRPPLPLGRAAWSPDGSRLVIAAFSSRPLRGRIPKRLFLLAADGGRLRPLKGTTGGTNPVFAPDGHTLAFAKERVVVKFKDDELLVFAGTSIWLVDIKTGKQRQLTPWRNGLSQEPSSFSPDGSVLAATRAVEDKRPEAIAIDVDDATVSALIPGSASDPVFSPDGTKVAFLRNFARRFGKKQDLYTARPGGEELRRLTKTPTLNESFPSWDPSGQRLAYGANEVISSAAEVFGLSGGVWTINADGTCATNLLASDRVFLGAPAWQPGPGREAGPLSC